jgi:hypothetical protein
VEFGERQSALRIEPAQLLRVKRFQRHVRGLNQRCAAVGSVRRPFGNEDRPESLAPDAVLRVEHRAVYGRRHTDGLRIAQRAREDGVEHHLVPHQGLIDPRFHLRRIGCPAVGVFACCP